MHTWWTGLAEAPPDEAQALHALGLGFMAHAHFTLRWNCGSLPI